MVASLLHNVIITVKVHAGTQTQCSVNRDCGVQCSLIPLPSQASCATESSSDSMGSNTEIEDAQLSDESDYAPVSEESQTEEE